MATSPPPAVGIDLGTTFSVLFGSGRVAREFDDTGDVTPAFR